MKIWKLLIISGPWLLLLGCASINEAPKTINSDLFPKSIDRASYYYEMAHALSGDGQHEKAVDFLRLAIAHNPGRPVYRLQLISDLEKLNQKNLVNQELTELKKIVQTDKNVAIQLFNQYFDQENYDAAKEVYLFWAARETQTPNWQWGLYSIAKVKKVRSEEIELLNKLADLQKDNPLVWSELANVFQKLGDQASEEKNLLRSYDLNRNQANVVLRLSQLAYLKGDIDKSSNYLQQFVLTNPFNNTISNSYANILVYQKAFDLADLEYDKQLRFAEDISLILLKKAHLKYLQKDFKNAYRQYDKLLRTNPSDEGFYYLGLTCKEMKDFSCATEAWNEVVADSNYYPDARMRMISLVDDSDKKLTLAEQSYHARTDSSELLKIYSELLLKDNQVKKAENILVKSGKPHLKNPDIVLLHAYVKHRLGDSVTFKKLINAALKMSPDNARIYSTLAKLWFDNDEAPSDTEFFARTALSFNPKTLGNFETKMILAWSLFKQQKIPYAMSVFEEAYDQNPLKAQSADDLASVYKWASAFIRSDEFATYAGQDKTEVLNKTYFSDVNKEEKPQRLPASFLNSQE